MKFKSYNDKTKEFELLDCPFCGTEPVVNYVGNNYTKKRQIEIKCPKCKIKRIEWAICNGFDWLEEISAKYWNQRIKKDKNYGT